MSLNKIFTYWEGDKPDYIKLCERTLDKCKDDFEIIRLKKVDMDLPINLKVDWLKANIIHEHGGFWVDADTIVMKNFKDLIPLVRRHKFAGIPGFFGAVKDSPILGRWIKKMANLLLNKEDLTFSALIDPLLKDKHFKEFGVFTKEMICPIYHTGDEFWKLFEDRPLKEILTDKNYVVCLYNSAFSKEFKKIKEQDILEKRWVISKMFHQAL